MTEETHVAALTHLILRVGERWLKEPRVKGILEDPARPAKTKVFQVRHLLWDQPYAA